MRRAAFGVLALAVVIRLIGLEERGFGTEYYAAGVFSMGLSLNNFLFNAFDPAGFLSLDKPPIAFWIQVLTTKILGFNWLGLLLPQVIEGCATVWIIYWLVARRFGSMAGILAGLLLVMSPINVAIDRSGNTDSALILLLACATMALILAFEQPRFRPLGVAAFLFGLAFNVKMLVAFVPLPWFAGVYLLRGPGAQRQRLAWLSLAGCIVLLVSLGWSAIYDLVPPDKRPFAGSSSGNSMLELVVVHNGIERFVKRKPTMQMTGSEQPVRFYDAVPTGPLRLTDRYLAAQFAWMAPIVLLLIPRRRREAAMTPTSPDLWLYAGWAASYTIIFSFTGGIFHAYYLAVIGPPLAALCGIGLAQAVEPGKIDRIRFGAVIALTALWQCYLGYGFVLENSTRLWPWVSLVAPVAAVMLASSISPRTAVVVGAVAGLFLVNPLLWSASTWSNAGPAILPAADLSVWNETGGDPERQWRKTVRQTEISSADPKLIAFLAANMGESKFAAVTPTTRLAAPIINRSGLPIMAFGGFSGLDPILSLDQLKERARNGDFRYVLFGAGVAQGPRPQLNDDDPRRAFIRWVRANGKPVPPALWRSPDANGERLFLFEIKLRDAGD